MFFKLFIGTTVDTRFREKKVAQADKKRHFAIVSTRVGMKSKPLLMMVLPAPYHVGYPIQLFAQDHAGKLVV